MAVKKVALPGCKICKQNRQFPYHTHNNEHIQQHSSEARANHAELCSLTSCEALATEARHVAVVAECSAWTAHVCPQDETNLPASVVVTEVCRNLQAPLGTEVGMQEHDISYTTTSSMMPLTNSLQLYMHQLMLSEQCNKHNAGKQTHTLPSCLDKSLGVFTSFNISVQARTAGMNEVCTVLRQRQMMPMFMVGNVAACRQQPHQECNCYHCCRTASWCCQQTPANSIFGPKCSSACIASTAFCTAQHVRNISYVMISCVTMHEPGTPKMCRTLCSSFN